MSDKDKNFGGYLVLNFRKWWRHMQAKNTHAIARVYFSKQVGPILTAGVVLIKTFPCLRDNINKLCRN